MKQTYQSWVHGNSVLLERVGSPSATNKASALGAYGNHFGDVVGTGDMGGAACFRMGWAARFVMIDLGHGNAPKGGNFWVHYALPTPTIQSGVQTLARKVMVNFESSSISEICIARLHVWDGNRRIFANDSVERTGDGHDGGIPKQGNSRSIPDMNQLLTADFADQRIFFGLCVSLNISANTARDEFLEIRGVGLEYAGEDRT